MARLDYTGGDRAQMARTSVNQMLNVIDEQNDRQEAAAIARAASDLGFGPTVTPTATEVALANAQATAEAEANAAASADAYRQRAEAEAARMGLTPTAAQRQAHMAEMARLGIVGADAYAIERIRGRNPYVPVGTPEMGFTPGMLAEGISPAAMYARYGVNAPSVMAYTEKPGFKPLLASIFGLNTPQEDLRLGLGQPVYDSKGNLRGELSTNALGGVVYGGNRFDPGPDHPYRDIIAPGPGYGGYDSSHENQIDIEEMYARRELVPPKGDKECPDGYTFDPDLNACRLDTRGGTTTAPDAPAAPGTPGAQYARMGLLDVAPEGLMGFQERYGAGFGTPADFGAANLAFRQQGAISPEYYQTPPKLTGYTLLG